MKYTEQTVKYLPQEQQDGASGVNMVSAELLLQKKNWNYSLFHNKEELLDGVRLENHGDQDLEHLMVSVTVTPEVVLPCSRLLERLPAHGEATVPFSLVMDADEVYALTDKLQAGITVRVMQGEEVLFENTTPVTVLCYDEWDATAKREFLASFVLSNHPVVEKINARAQKILDRKTGYGGMSGYQHKNPQRVQQVASAIYEAISGLGITYCTAPPSFERTGQRVRLPDRILHDVKANCMDSTLLYGACLEAAGIRVALILVTGHIFLAYFTEESNLPTCVCTDLGKLQQLVSDGTLIPVECTMMCKGPGKAAAYENAVNTARDELGKNFNYAVDVDKARTLGVTPMPVAKATGEATEEPDEDQDDEDTLIVLPEEPEVELSPEEKKFYAWRDAVLPVTKANPALNTKIRDCIPLCSISLSRLRGMVEQKGVELVSCPGGQKSKMESFESVSTWETGLEDFCQSDQVVVGLTDGVLEKRLKSILKKDKRNQEQYGYNTIALGYGLLCWKDKEETEKRYAPILLQPVTLNLESGICTLVSRGELTWNPALKLRLQREEILLKCGEQPTPGEAMESVKQAIRRQKDWAVLEAGVIGNFAGGAYAMYRDLSEHREYLMEHPITRSLLEGKIYFDVDGSENLTRKASGSQVLDPLGLNQHQKKAIEAAKKGASLILVGPPGTGKTQTLVGLADIAAQGKPVLLVTSKKAAADVLYDRLTSLGLDRYCLRLEPGSTEKVKKHLRTTLERKKTTPGDYDAVALAETVAEMAVKSYFDELNGSREAGMTLGQLVEQVESLRTIHGFTQGYVPDVACLTEERIREQVELIRQMAPLAKEIGPGQHPLKELELKDYHPGMKYELRESFARQIDLVALLTRDGGRIASAFHDPEPKTVGEHQVLLKKLKDCSKITGEMLEQLPDVKQALGARKEAEDLQKKLRKVFSAGLFMLDGCAMAERYEKANPFTRQMALTDLGKQLQVYTRRKLTNRDVIPYVEMLGAWQRAQDRYGQVRAHCKEAYGAEPEEIMTQAERFFELCSGGDQDSVLALVADGTLEQYEKNLETLAERPEKKLEEISQEHRSYMEHMDLLQDWAAWCRLREKAVKLELSGPLEAFEEGIDGTVIEQAWKKAVYNKLIRSIIGTAPVLRDFSGISFSHQTKVLAEARKVRQEGARQELIARLEHNVPDLLELGMQSTAAGRFMTRLNDDSSLRQIFGDPELCELALRTCPMVLSTPEMVSEVFPMDRFFHLVAIDEASQVQVAHAAGVIARANGVMIVGDPKQLPPTTFFQTQIGGEELSESILNETENLNFPKVMLKEHYRSRHEDLIAFANEKFYDGELVTLPAAGDVQSHVRLLEVSGQFDHGKTRTNLKEAQAVVEQLIQISKNPEMQSRSVGVITFNFQQENLIESLFLDACQKDQRLQQWAFEGEEPLFIKNLENVQGDERDVILLSVGYSAKENGTMSMNFGPLNQNGGRRRLNVAITRAREEMLVFCSFEPELIPEATASEGAKVLKEFLVYAREHKSASSQHQQEQKSGAISRAICQELRQHGYEWDTCVGSSSFLVDIAVKDSAGESYALGILLDDDGSRDALLENLGWSLYHVYALDWLSSRETVLRRLLERLKVENG